MSATFASPRRGGAARRRAAALRVEAAQLRARSRSRAPRRRSCAAFILGAGPLFPVAAARRAARPSALLGCVRRRASPRACCRRCSRARSTPSEDASSACRSTGCGGRRSAASSSASAGSSARRRSASATTDPGAPRRRRAASARCCALVLVKATIWVDLARLGHVGRRARAAAHDGRALGALEAPLLPGMRPRASGRSSAWARSSAARCARR